MSEQRGVARRGEIELAYQVRGQGDAIVLLIMGLGGRSADWGEPFPKALAEDRRVIVFDNRGTGRSSKPRGPYSIAEMARDAIAVLDAVGAPRADVIGFSMGGMIAQHLALDHAARVDRMVLLATHCGGRNATPPMDVAMAAMMPPLPGASIPELIASRVRAITAPGFAEREPALVEEIVAIALGLPTPSACFMAQLQAVIDDDRFPRLDAIRTPTLVVHGDRDSLVPHPNGVTLHARIAGSSLVTLEGCGHLVSWEKPRELTDVVRAFFARE